MRPGSSASNRSNKSEPTPLDDPEPEPLVSLDGSRDSETGEEGNWYSTRQAQKQLYLDNLAFVEDDQNVTRHEKMLVDLSPPQNEIIENRFSCTASVNTYFLLKFKKIFSDSDSPIETRAVPIAIWNDDNFFRRGLSTRHFLI